MGRYSMGAMLANPAPKLNRTWRLLGALVIAALLFALGAAWLNAQTQASLQAAQTALIQAAQAGGQAVHQDLRQRMVGNDRDTIRLILGDANNVPGLQRVMVIGPNGHVYLDSWQRSQGDTLATSLPNCVECHQNAKPPTSTRLAYQADLVRVATPITSDTSCSSCHLSNGSNLGVILVDVSMGGLQAQATRNLWIGLAIIGGLALLAGALAYWLLGFAPPLPVALRLPGWRLPDLHLSGRVSRLQVFWLLGTIGLLLLAAAGGGTVSAQLESNDSFCTSCHTQPETTYFARSQAPAVDLASVHTTENVACIDCHSGEGVVGRAEAIAQGAQNLALYASGHYQSPAVLRGSLASANCLKCHAEVTTDNTPANHFHYYLAQWQASDPQAATCATCHQGHTTGGSGSEHFLQDVVTDGVCQQCHATAKTAR